MLNFLKEFTGTAIMCEKCGSKYIKYSDVEKRIVGDEVVKVTAVQYDVQCRECGAKGKVTEVWD